MDENKVVMEWKSEERVFSGKSKDYYSTVVVLAILVGIVLFFIEGIMPVLVVGAIVFVMFALARTKPRMVETKITRLGVENAGELYRWEELREFWIDGKEGRRVLHALTTRRWPSQLLLVLPEKGVDEKELKKEVGKYLTWQMPGETRMDRVVKWFNEKVPLE